MDPIEGDNESTITSAVNSSTIQNSPGTNRSTLGTASTSDVQESASISDKSSSIIEREQSESRSIGRTNDDFSNNFEESIGSNEEPIQQVEDFFSKFHVFFYKIVYNFLLNKFLKILTPDSKSTLNFTFDKSNDYSESSDGDNSSDDECNVDNHEQYYLHEEESPFTYLHNLLKEDEFNETIDANIIVSKSELLLGILKFSEKAIQVGENSHFLYAKDARAHQTLIIMDPNIVYLEDEVSNNPFLWRYSDPSTTKLMIYLRHGYSLERESWNSILNSKTESLFCKKLLRHFFDDQELRQMGVNRGREIPDEFVDMTKKCLEYFNLIHLPPGTTISTAAMMQKIKKVRHFFCEIIHFLNRNH
uniref:Uncharacterized protein n=1 Tax=Trichogramma kaykai TaxID=54128 RepID=A0ABD2WD11_9HYME